MGKLILPIFFYILQVCSSKFSASDSPRFLVEDGNLIFHAADGKHIRFKTQNAAGITVNNVDLLPTLDRAHNATKLLESYQKAFATYEERIESLEQRISTQPSQIDNGTNSTYVLNSIRILNRALIVLRRKVLDLETSLVQDNCVGNPCKNGGVCQDMYNGYACHCLSGWQGVNCLENVDECAAFQGTDLGCQNGASCVDKPGSYECVCLPGFVGIHCNRRKANCETGGAELCGHGTCVHQNTQAGYKCICDQGWTTDGTNPACTVDVNECTSYHPACSKDPPVPCINVPGSFYCGACPVGYTGNGYFCANINECEINNGGCSVTPKVTCIDTPGSRICSPCPAGYEGDGVTCVYKGVCHVNNGGCHYLAQCRDNPRISPTYVECICPAKYVGNGIGPNGCVPATPVSPCISNPCLNGDCSVNAATNDYVCRCKKRYTGRNCDILKDPCTPNPCQNGGTCQNMAGIRFQCVCPSGFSGMLCETERRACGGKLKGLTGNLTYPPADYETYGPRLSCAWTIETNTSKVLNLTFIKFDIEKSTGCQADWLQIHDGPNSASLPLGKFCGTDLPMGGKIVSTHNIIYLWFRSNAGNAREGFSITWNSTNPVCGGEILATSHGSIQSPGSPGNYPPNRDCYWAISGPPFKRFLFHFYSLNIGNNRDCSKDFIEFLETWPQNTFTKICNSSIPAPFYSPGNKVTVHFHSDGEDSYPGFQMTYSVLEDTPGCGGSYSSKSGIILSPQADDREICVYKIAHRPYTVTKITFLSIDIPDNDCRTSYIEIRDGADVDSPILHRICDSTLLPPIRSYGPITIVSPTFRTANHWKVKYESVCGQKFYNSTGSLESPIQMTTNCIYQIEQPPGYRIKLTIKTNVLYVLNRIYRPECNVNYVVVRDGDSEDAPLLKKFCNTTSEVITSTHNHLWIQYGRRYSYSMLKFEATYQSIDVGCGGIIKDQMGYIAFPSNRTLASPVRCTWVLMAPPKSVIQLNWITFNVKLNFKCRDYYLKLFDNNTDSGEGNLMGTYCGSTVPPTSTSSGNVVTLMMKSSVVNKDSVLVTYLTIPESKVCGANFYSTSGIIKSPGYPKSYPSNKECSWTINVPQGQQIMLNVTDFYLEGFGCRYDWLEIRNGATLSSPIIGKFCDTKITKIITSHTNHLFLRFVSDLSRSYRGFSIAWSSTATGCGGILTSPTGSLISPNYPEPYGRSTECIWKITLATGSKIQLLFSDINFEGTEYCDKYPPDYVELFDGLTINSKSLGKFCDHIPKPILSSSNQVLVKFRSDASRQGRGFQLHYSIVCNNTLRGFRGVIQSPNFHQEYPQHLNCWWNILVPHGNKINLTFSHFEFNNGYVSSETNPTCNSDYVEIRYVDTEQGYSGDDDEFVTLGSKHCGSNPGLIAVNSDRAQVHLVKGNMGLAFRLEWQLVGCGGILTDPSGTIQSPNYPKPFPGAVVCEWTIRVNFGYGIQIQFNEVDVATGSCYDYPLQIYDGPGNSSTLITKICHQQKPTIVSSSGNQMFIEFKGDYSYEGKGFTANYSVIPAKCGGKLVAREGSIFSPNYPNNFKKYETCYWLIEVDETHAINLKFEDIDLPDCRSSYVKLFDGPSEDYPVLETVCSNGTNQTFTSTFNQMYVVLRVGDLPAKGFLAKYTRSCGSRIVTERSGVIKITQQDFPDDSNCTWTIVSKDPTRHITLTVSQTQMHVLYDTYCEYTNPKPVSIYGGETVNSPLLKSYCDNKIPPPIISDGSAITIQLTWRMNFFATYSVLDSDCGGVFNSQEGFFASPGYPNKYPVNTQCEWIINVAPGNRVSLSFQVFDLLQSEKCSTDFFEIRSHNISGPLLGIYCGTNKPENDTHQASLWMMYKSSKVDSGTTITSKGFYGEFTLDKYNELSGPQGVIASPLYPDLYWNYEMFAWKITVSPRKIILITFKEFYLEGNTQFDECLYVYMKFYDGVDETAPVIDTVCGIVKPDPIKSTTNIMYVTLNHDYVMRGSKFLLEWLEVSAEPKPKIPTNSTVEGCGSSDIIDVNSRKIVPITSPGFPNGYKQNLNCTWTFSTIPQNHLQVYFPYVDLKGFYINARQFPWRDYVLVEQRHDDSNDWELLRKVSEKPPIGDLVETSNLMRMRFVSGSLQNGTGFKAVISQSCGGSLTGPTGFIYVYTTTTTHLMECEWNVTVRSGKTIRVTFEQMDIAHDTTKGCDNYVLLKNGKYPDSPILGLGKYCGTKIPEQLNTTGNHLYVKYRGSARTMHFRLKYQEVSVECGGEITLTPLENSTEINSPNYPNIPQPHTECSWRINAPPGESLRIDFEERFDLTYHKECEIEYVELRDGGTEFSTLIGRYCSHIPSTQFSTDNMMFIKFFTDTPDPRNGFKAKISMEYCGGTVRGNEGDIVSPERVVADKNLNCTWHIVGPAGHYMDVKVILLKKHNNFLNTKLIIEEPVGDFNTVQNRKVYVGNVLPPPFTSASNKVIIQFIGSSEDKFHLKFNTSQTTCGGYLSAESGTITSPGYPSNIPYRYCNWKLQVPEGRRITLNFQDIDVDSQIIAVYEGMSFKLRLVLIRARAIKQTVETSSNKMSLSFLSRSGSSGHRGFKAVYSSNKPTICTSDFSAESGILTQPDVRNNTYWCEWVHTSADTFTNRTFAMTISLKANLTKPYHDVFCAYPEWAIKVTNQDEKNILVNLCSPNVQNRVIRSPFPVTRLNAFARYEMNFTVSYNTYKCGGMLGGQEGVIASPNHPNTPSESMECAWLIRVDKEQIINVTVLTMDLGKDCDKNFVEIFNGELPTRPKLRKYCKGDKQDIVISQGNSLLVEYKYEKGASGNGFKMKYEAMSLGCGGTFLEMNRVIQTPNYGKDYPNNAECLWEIHSVPGYHIELHFVERFHIEESDNCVNDYIEVWDWRDRKWTLIAKRCGRDVPTGIQSTEDKLRLLFRSNNKTTASGFKAKWTWTCGGRLEATSTPRTVVSPGYPVFYSSNLKCVYNITSPTSETINVRFDDFDLEDDGADCKHDNITIDSRYLSPFIPIRRSYCGSTLPPTLRLRENIVITFQTDKWIPRKGFRFTYNDESCGGDINETTTIKAPFFDDQMSTMRYVYPRIRCVWSITAPPKQIAILSITRLSVATFCYGQGLSVYEGSSQTMANRLAVFCGDLNFSVPIHAESGRMLVVLDSGVSNYKGFEGEVYFSHGPQEGCGGKVNLTDTKYIQAPNLADLDCTWTIIAPQDYQIEVHFTELNMPGVCARNSTSCSYVEVRDGGSPLSELIERLDSTSNSKPDYRKFRTSNYMGYIRLVVIGRQDNAFKATLKAVPSICGPSVLTVTKEVKTLSTPNYPNKYQPGMKCSWVLTTSTSGAKIELRFLDFDLTGGSYNSAEKKCEGDSVEIQENSQNQIMTQGFGPDYKYSVNKRPVLMNFDYYRGRITFCGADSSPFDYYSLTSAVSLTFRSVLSTDQGKGFKLEYRVPGCDRNYTNLQGRLFNALAESNCTMIIAVPENRTISVYFERLSTIYSLNCTLSVFEIRDGGPQGDLLIRTCGFRAPNPIFSHTSKLYINVFATYTYRPSYNLAYTSTDAGRGCGGEFYDHRGFVSSPLYPDQFRNNTVCTWVIRVPQGLYVALKFTTFDIQGICSDTNVKVTTFSADGATSSNTFCPNDNPAIIRSHSRIDIKYRSSVHNGGNGFLGTFQGMEDENMEIR